MADEPSATDYDAFLAMVTRAGMKPREFEGYGGKRGIEIPGAMWMFRSDGSLDHVQVVRDSGLESMAWLGPRD